MTLWCDWEIVAAVRSGRVQLDPFDLTLVQPASVDVRLSGEFLVQDGAGVIDPEKPVPMRHVTASADDPYRLPPGGFALGCTVETVGIPADMAARYEGKSSLGRLGLGSHVTAGFIDPGFTGQVTLELVNHTASTVLLRPGMRIGQLCFIPLVGPCARPYGADGLGSHYQGQRGPTASLSHA